MVRCGTYKCSTITQPTRCNVERVCLERVECSIYIHALRLNDDSERQWQWRLPLFGVNVSKQFSDDDKRGETSVKPSAWHVAQHPTQTLILGFEDGERPYLRIIWIKWILKECTSGTILYTRKHRIVTQLPNFSHLWLLYNSLSFTLQKVFKLFINSSGVFSYIC